MAENIVIVESPAKAKTISKFLGKDFEVKSCMGHIRDLAKNEFSIDIKNNFKPIYVILDEKKKIVNELKKEVKKFNKVWLASDEDREGEAIAWHLKEVLNLPDEKTHRIVFHEITKDAILEAIKNPRNINLNLVNAQQARRILDRIVGYEVSPILWKKVKPALSAGRVQSVAVRLIVEREREIINFKETAYYKIIGYFKGIDKNGKEFELKATLDNKFETEKDVINFLEKCKNAYFKIDDISVKPYKKTPPPPFITSTLQQEASRKFGFPVAFTMKIAQNLYESGKITYMRTDSVNLSQLALNTAKKLIEREFGNEYVHIRNYKSKVKGAQEAHEAIRPTYIENETITGSDAEKKLYELIWKRTLASQMSDAELEKTTITIKISNCNEKFIAIGEIIKFDGFLKLYMESSDDETSEEHSSGIIPPLEINQELKCIQIDAIERFTNHPPRYNEATLVRKLEELGIGRPSTYAPIISTIQQRGYVIKKDIPPKERNIKIYTLKNNEIKELIKKETYGAEKGKLIPDNIGLIVNDFLIQHFSEIMDYNFTANIEKEFDEIAAGNLDWVEMIKRFYEKFHPKVENTLKNAGFVTGERILGIDPESGKPVIVKIGKYGPVVQIGDNNDKEKPRYTPLPKNKNIENITLEEALDLFKFPKKIGTYDGKDIIVGTGRFGPYINYNNKFYSLRKEDDPLTIDENKAIEIINEKNKAEQNKILKEFQENKNLKILNGPWGAYIKYGKKNYKIPKDKNPELLSYEECMEIIKNQNSK